VIKPLQKKIAETFDPILDAQKAALKVATGKRDEALKPTQEAERFVKGLISDYHERADEARRRLAARIREREQQDEAARRKLEDAGRPVPVALQPVAPAPELEAPRVAGVSTKKAPKYEVLDAALLKPAFLLPDGTKIGKTVRALGLDAVDTVSADPAKPAIRVWHEREVSARADE